MFQRKSKTEAVVLYRLAVTCCCNKCETKERAKPKPWQGTGPKRRLRHGKLLQP